MITSLFIFTAFHPDFIFLTMWLQSSFTLATIHPTFSKTYCLALPLAGPPVMWTLGIIFCLLIISFLITNATFQYNFQIFSLYFPTLLHKAMWSYLLFSFYIVPSTLSEIQLLIKNLKKNIINLGHIILQDNIVFETMSYHVQNI